MSVDYRTEIILGWQLPFNEMTNMLEKIPEETDNCIFANEYLDMRCQNVFYGKRIVTVEPGNCYSLSSLGYDMPNIEEFNEKYWPRLVKMGRKDLTRKSAELFVVNGVR